VQELERKAKQGEGVEKLKKQMAQQQVDMKALTQQVEQQADANEKLQKENHYLKKKVDLLQQHNQNMIQIHNNASASVSSSKGPSPQKATSSTPQYNEYKRDLASPQR